jgi:uncharacterized protein YbbC (DUF1343 family)
MKKIFLTLLLGISVLASVVCVSASTVSSTVPPAKRVPPTKTAVSVQTIAAPSSQITVGAQRMDRYLPLLANKRVGIITNHTGTIGGRHLVDTLLARGVRVELVFAPEHGFRGTAAAGEHVSSTRDAATGLEIVSLYGANRKPTPGQIGRCDVVLFDIQDVGCRFYTYLSTMHYAMEACAEGGKPFIVLDRPNPNGMLVDGPVLDTARHRSFVGMHPIPVLHGMTLGELARMINGEGWLTVGRNKPAGRSVSGVQNSTGGRNSCDLTVIECQGWTREARYELPISPSPALPNMRSVYLYPSLCYFEATKVSVGRGGEWPFQVLTRPDGAVVDLRTVPTDDAVIARGIDLSYLIDAWCAGGGDPKFLSSFFERLIGVGWVREMIVAGCTAEEISARWAGDVARFRREREPYLIYK